MHLVSVHLSSVLLWLSSCDLRFYSTLILATNNFEVTYTKEHNEKHVCIINDVEG